MGLGIGVVAPAIIMLAMSGAEPAETGLVSGLTNTAQQAGAALGLAVLAVVAARVTDSSLAGGADEVAALRDGYSRAFLAAAGFSVGALIIGAWVLRRPPLVAAASDTAAGVAVTSTAPVAVSVRLDADGAPTASAALRTDAVVCCVGGAEGSDRAGS